MNVSAAQRGVTYLALLLAVAITSGALAAAASIWSQTQRRERETQLLWAGDQIRKAIIAYSQFATDSRNNLPATLQDLLLDPRSPARRRFLRQIYDDPMTHSADWGIIRNPQGRIVGVYSRSDRVPLKTGRFPALYANFEKAATYADWKFTTVPELRVGDRPGAVSGAARGSAPGIGNGASAAPAPVRATVKPPPVPADAASANAPAAEVPVESPTDLPIDAPSESVNEDDAADRSGN